MKRCPSCNRAYDDDSMRFCLDDGTSLVTAGIVPTIASPTLVLPTSEENPPTLTQAARPDVPPPKLSVPTRDSAGRDEQLSRSISSGSSGSAVVIGFILAVTVVLIIAGFGLWGKVFAKSSPMLLLCLTGVAFAMTRGSRHPRPSLMTGLGLGLYVLYWFLYSGFIREAPRLSLWFGFSDSQMQTIYTVILVLIDFLYAGVIVLLVAAAFASRKPAPATN
jgi:hypothetical protein